jgi:L-threonylcarbamoyladenylate synthase
LLRAQILQIEAVDPSLATLEHAAALLRAGKLVAMPTETVYGLAGLGLDEAAVARIYVAKGRPAHNPVILHVSDLAMAQRLTTGWSVLADRLAQAFWPGPLTLVLPKSPHVPAIVTAGGPTVAIRMPDHAVARGLIACVGAPLAAPSANRSGEVSPTRAQHVLDSLGQDIDAILDAGPCLRGIESTVIDLSTDPPTLLRPGPLSPTAIAHVLQQPVTAFHSRKQTFLPSPGLLPRHYAPRVPLRLYQNRTELEQLRTIFAAPMVGLAFAPIADFLDISWVNMPTEPAAYAACLYERLHAWETQANAIFVEQPPHTEPWHAVLDRLQRAAHDA